MDGVFRAQPGPRGLRGDKTELVIQREILALLFAGLPRGLVVTLINAALTAFVLRDYAAGPMVWLWLTLILVVTVIRAGMAAHYFKDAQKFSPNEWSKRFFLGAVASGMGWGSAALLLMPSDSMGHQMFVGFMLGGMAAGAMASLSFDHKTYAAYVAASVGPYQILMLWNGGEIQIVMGVLAGLFIVMMIQGGKTFHQSIIETLRLRFEKEALAGELKSTGEQQAEANTRLKIEVERTAAAEAQMRVARDEAYAANLAKSQFLANMSHEIRTPMNGVMGMTDLLLKSPLGEHQIHLARTIKASGGMLLSIIDDILDLSRIEAGKLELSRERFDPCHTIAGTGDMLAGQAAQKGLQLKFEIDPALPSAAIGDPVRLRQVFVNLIGNAIKFTTSGSVTVRVNVGDSDAGKLRLEVEVRDTGIGIDTAALDRIMMPFEQADSSTSRRYGGTGLGLAICCNLVAMMGGALKVASEPGHGTRVTFDIVMDAAVGDAAMGRRATDQRSFKGCHVLVAEDNPVNQEVARAYLEELGCTVDIVENGREAVEAFAKKRYTIVLMDCQMPELDGLEATLEIRALERNRAVVRTPIVALTASAFQEDRERCLAVGMDDHLSKPYSETRLAVTLAKWVRDTTVKPASVKRGGRHRKRA